ncbi:hypothetical protein GSI_12348 [Ganoderma sinense ZZ0214-1]|uniref:Uncharacterized protein n=1 Tax=Ganoderma sinense ZZ0214-1 TaxID=1077348 RepID=A0A2G8RYK3_9APHY|nr:hypothetical protein GSI_12348 [Ganoderma sinense ZZ0214-1]
MSDIVQHVLSLFTSSPPSDESNPVQVPAETTPPATTIAQESDLPCLAALRTRAAHHLMVFDDPRYAHLDVPSWVRRAAPQVHHVRVTVRGLIGAMCDGAAELGLADGERYVLETVCACAAGDADSMSVPVSFKTEAKSEAGEREREEAETETETETEALAWRLQHLASAWAAFLLWPFYARMQDPESFARGHASPCTGLSHARKAMAFGEFDPDECLLRSSYPLRNQVLARDGQRCMVSGAWDIWSRVRAPPGTRWGHVNAVRIFKHPLVVYRDVYDRDKAKRESVLLSLEVLRRFCELDSRYFDVEPGGASVMDDPANLLSLCCNAHAKFDAFGLCFVPTQPPPRLPPTHSLPRTVTFEDLHLAPSSSPQPRASLPSRELLRGHAALGSVLYADGAALASVFERIEEPLSRERPDESELPVPDPDGASFWRDLVVDDGGTDLDQGASLAECEPDLDEFARVLGVASLPTA